MKNLLFSFLTLITVSIFSVSLVSCGGDDDTATSAKDSYSFEYSLSSDFFKICDVKTIVTVGNNTTVLTYGKSETRDFLGEKYSCLTTGSQTFEAAKGTTVTAKTTVTLKSNWKEIASQMEDLTVLLHYGIMDTKRYNNDTKVSVLDTKDEQFENKINRYIELLSETFDYSSK